MYIDAFGWKFFQERMEQYPFLQRFVREGVASKLTSQFPSTTSAHMTTIHLGLPVGQSGIFEWFYYEPLLDRLIAPLMFSYAGDAENGTIKLPEGIQVNQVFQYRSLYEQLADRGVQSVVVQNRDYNRGGFASLALNGAKLVGYKTLAESFTLLADVINHTPGPAYIYYYFDWIDAIGHQYGPSSAQFQAEVDTFLTTAERLLHNSLHANGGRTLLLVTADHGQVDIAPETTVYLNQQVPEIAQMIRRDGGGRLLVPGGSARDLFLYIQPGMVDAAFALLHDHPSLAGKAEVRRVSEMITAGYFGAEPVSEAFMARIADLVILPYAGESVYWYEQGRFEQTLRGHHGGMTPAELEIPLLTLPY
jgi:predicted AlkP superfamily pyrophosphatase or phosphodiesterase